MSQLPLSSHILDHLEEAIREQALDRSIGWEMLPALSEALEPVIAQYMAKKECFPDTKSFCTIVNNFNQDGSRIEALLKTRDTNDYQHWLLLREQLLAAARRKWGMISSADQKEIADRTWQRIHRYLPGFLFVARFSTWVTRILINEYLRLKPKVERDRQKRSLDEVDEQGRTLADKLPSHGRGLLEKVEQQQASQQFWQRMEQLEQSLNLNILRLHLEGYTLEEIKQKLGGKPSVSTIWKRRQQVMVRIEEDEIMQEIAQQLGILPLTEKAIHHASWAPQG